MNHIRQINSELEGLCTNKSKDNTALEIWTKQEDRMIQIKESMNLLLIENFSNDEIFSLNLWPSSQTSNSFVCSLTGKLQNVWNACQNSEIYDPSENSRVFYLLLNERKRTSESANNLSELTLKC